MAQMSRKPFAAVSRMSDEEKKRGDALVGRVENDSLVREPVNSGLEIPKFLMWNSHRKISGDENMSCNTTLEVSRSRHTSDKKLRDSTRRNLRSFPRALPLALNYGGEDARYFENSRRRTHRTLLQGRGCLRRSCGNPDQGRALFLCARQEARGTSYNRRSTHRPDRSIPASLRQQGDQGCDQTVYRNKLRSFGALALEGLNRNVSICCPTQFERKRQRSSALAIEDQRQMGTGTFTRTRQRSLTPAVPFHPFRKWVLFHDC